jgi:hypothetical protein
MSSDLQSCLIQQFDTAWKLADFHLTGLSTEECLWRPARRGLHVHPLAQGRWIADWPEHEGYDLGPPSIAWVTWHMGFWWSMVLDHSFGERRLTRESVYWPGAADAACEWLVGLKDAWRSRIQQATEADLESTRCTHWPFQNRPFRDVIAWATVELTKNAAELGYARFLYAVRADSGGVGA